MSSQISHLHDQLALLPLTFLSLFHGFPLLSQLLCPLNPKHIAERIESELAEPGHLIRQLLQRALQAHVFQQLGEQLQLLFVTVLSPQLDSRTGGICFPGGYKSVGRLPGRAMGFRRSIAGPRTAVRSRGRKMVEVQVPESFDAGEELDQPWNAGCELC
jgi:hypothetical protein